MMNANENDDNISRVMGDSERVRQVIQDAIVEALMKHKQAGNPVCGAQNGEVFWIQPEDILIKKV